MSDVKRHPRRAVVGVSCPIKLVKMPTTAKLECGHLAKYTSKRMPKTLVCRECPQGDVINDQHPPKKTLQEALDEVNTQGLYDTVYVLFCAFETQAKEGLRWSKIPSSESNDQRARRIAEMRVSDVLKDALEKAKEEDSNGRS